MINFPAIRPTSRSVTQGQYAVKRFTSISGAGSTRIYGSQPFGAKLTLEFNNLADENTVLIVQAYESAYGSKDSLLLPNEIWDGMDLQLRLKLERDYLWRFFEQPQITSGRPGRSSISVTLEGQRDH